MALVAEAAGERLKMGHDEVAVFWTRPLEAADEACQRACEAWLARQAVPHMLFTRRGITEQHGHEC